MRPEEFLGGEGGVCVGIRLHESSVDLTVKAPGPDTPDVLVTLAALRREMCVCVCVCMCVCKYIYV